MPYVISKLTNSCQRRPRPPSHLYPQVLSVVAQQLHALQSALRAGAERVMFEGREIRVLSSCGVFVTMNPGYAGRTELPDNLKVGWKHVCLNSHAWARCSPITIVVIIIVIVVTIVIIIIISCCDDASCHPDARRSFRPVALITPEHALPSP